MTTLEAFGWSWRDNGADVFVRLSGTTYRVFVPLSTIHLSFGKAFAGVGCAFSPSVGGPSSVGGLFSSLRKAVTKAGRFAGKAVRRGVRAVKRAARKTVRRAYRGARGAVRSGYAAARALSRGDIRGAMARGVQSYVRSLDALDPTGISSRMAQNPQVRSGMVAAAAAFPATAPFAPAIAAANKAYTDFQRGQAAARMIRAGRRHPALLRTVQRGLDAREGVAQMAQLAAAREPRAMQIMGAFQQLGTLGGVPGNAGFW